MAKRRRRRIRGLLGALAGLALAPTSLLTLYSAARVLAGLGARAASTQWFIAGFGGYAALYFLGLRLRPAYVFAHELTHAMAAWMGGASVLRFRVGAEDGSVSLSRSNAFVALAPYWVPLYALAVIAAYRVATWAAPGLRVREAFLAAMGAALAFHAVHTVESLWTAHQDDLDDAGLLLSFSLILLLNGAVLLAALKCLFPKLVFLGEAAGGIWGLTRAFWGGAARLGGRALGWAAGLL